MGWFSGIVVYILLWWVLLFTVLPWGNAPADAPVTGHATGAPARPRLRMKFIATTVLAAIVWLVVFFLMKLDIIDFHDMASTMMREDGLK